MSALEDMAPYQDEINRTVLALSTLQHARDAVRTAEIKLRGMNSPEGQVTPLYEQTQALLASMQAAVFEAKVAMVDASARAHRAWAEKLASE